MAKSSALQPISCVDIVSCLLDDHNRIWQQLLVLRSQQFTLPRKREALNSLVPLLSAYAHAEEEVVISRALEFEELRVRAMEALEEHEMADVQVQRVKQSGDEVQMEARLNVLCDLLEQHLKKETTGFFPDLRARISEKERAEMGTRYREVKERNELAPVLGLPVQDSLLEGEAGRVGYIIAWFLGVPFWILILVFLIRGH